jgi:hypothetical protein
MTFQDFKAANPKTIADWPGVLTPPGAGGLVLLQNQSIVPGWRFVLSSVEPYYVARIYSFESLGEAREFCLQKDGVMVAGFNTCVVFCGVAGSDLTPISINSRLEMEGFLGAAALFVQAKGG